MATSDTTQRPRSPRFKGMIATGLLATLTLTIAFSMVSTQMEITLAQRVVDGGNVTMQEVESNDNR